MRFLYLAKKHQNTAGIPRGSERRRTTFTKEGKDVVIERGLQGAVYNGIHVSRARGVSRATGCRIKIRKWEMRGEGTTTARLIEEPLLTRGPKCPMFPFRHEQGVKGGRALWGTMWHGRYGTFCPP